MFNILCANTIQIMYTFTGWVLGTAGYVPVLKITQSLTCCDPEWQGDISDVTFLTTNTSNTHTPAGNVFTSQQQSGNIYIYPNIEVRDRSGRSVSASTNLLSFNTPYWPWPFLLLYTSYSCSSVARPLWNVRRTILVGLKIMVAEFLDEKMYF